MKWHLTWPTPSISTHTSAVSTRGQTSALGPPDRHSPLSVLPVWDPWEGRWGQVKQAVSVSLTSCRNLPALPAFMRQAFHPCLMGQQSDDLFTHIGHAFIDVLDRQHFYALGDTHFLNCCIPPFNSRETLCMKAWTFIYTIYLTITSPFILTNHQWTDMAWEQGIFRPFFTHFCYQLRLEDSTCPDLFFMKLSFTWQPHEWVIWAAVEL